jgi:aromatic ring-cleaving dioxygenase
MGETKTAATPRPIAEIASYHAHIYYDPAATRPIAEQLRVWIGERFAVQLGRWHDLQVGPHDAAMFQVAFANEVFATLVPWLMLNHGGLSILVHPNTVNPQRDHVVDPFWIGARLPIHDDKLPLESAPEEAPEANTTPRISP